MARRRAMLAAGKKPRLPKEYQEVEFVQTTGTQRIGIGYLPYSTTTWELTLAFTLTGVYQGNGSYVFANPVQRFNVCVTAGGMFEFSAGAVTTPTVVADENKHVLKFNKDFWMVDDIQGEMNQSVPVSRSNYFQIGCRYEPGYGMSNWCSEKIYGSRAWGGDTLIRDLVTCYRKSDNKPGMFDLVTKIFYTNGGTGELIVGPNVN